MVTLIIVVLFAVFLYMIEPVVEVFVHLVLAEYWKTFAIIGLIAGISLLGYLTSP